MLILNSVYMYILSGLEEPHGIEQTLRHLVPVITLQTVHYFVLVLFCELVEVGALVPEPLFVFLHALYLVSVCLLGLVLGNAGLNLCSNQFFIQFPFQLKHIRIWNGFLLLHLRMALLLINLHLLLHQVKQTARLALHAQTLLGLHLQVLEVGAAEWCKRSMLVSRLAALFVAPTVVIRPRELLRW